MLLAFRAQDLGLAQALGLEHGGALLALGLHLPRHGAGKVRRREDVLDLDARDLGAPGRGRRVEDAQQPLVDLVAVGQQLVEIHRADDGADIGHGEDEERLVEVRHLVGGARRIEDLIEGGGIDGDARIVPGEGLLARNVEHLLHDVHPLADLLDVRNDQPEAGAERAGIAPEALDRIGIALRHGADAHGDRQHDHERRTP